jgi:membrane protein DedA with SNARE-associated domain
MKFVAFLLAVLIGRLLRFGILSVLTIAFGPQIVADVKFLVKAHPVILAITVLALGIGIYLVFRLLRQPAKEIAEEIRHDEAGPE